MLGQATSAANHGTELVKSRIHRKILSLIDLRTMENLAPDRLRNELKILAEKLLDEEGIALNETERRHIVQSIQNEMLGLGPIEPLLADATVSDILVNGASRVYVERRGRLEETGIRFDNDAHLLRIIDKIVSRVGRRIDESSPMVDARLPDGSRVNAIIAPLAL
ncbi:MAG TPA: ATPase, T2SS/T4P/T4SS family, partial [Aquabacterium sp.]|nr:ATPase, T2SS/T4P/T4SS family [Aquabacterium sp.]